MPQPMQSSRIQTLKQALLAPGALASAIDAGLGWRLPGLVIALAVVALGFLSFPLFLKALPQMAPQGLSPHQLAQLEQTSRMMQPIKILLSPVGLMIRWAITGFLLYLMSVLVNRRSSFKKFFVLVVHASLVPLIEAVVKNILIWIRYALRGTIVLDPSIGLDAIFQSKGTALSVLLEHANLFEIWFLSVLIVGVSVLCRCTKRAAAALVLPVWTFWLLGHIAFAMVREVLTRQLGA